MTYRLFCQENIAKTNTNYNTITININFVELFEYNYIIYKCEGDIMNGDG